MLALSTLLLFCVSVGVAQHENHFQKCKVYRVSSNSSQVLTNLHKFYSEGKFDFWKRPTPQGTDVMVEEGEEESAFLEAFQHEPFTNISLLIPNVHDLLELEGAKNKFKSGGAVVTWDSYQSLQTIHEWMESLHAFYPDTTTLLNIGQSSEGLPLLLMKISKKESNNSTLEKKAVFIDATTHAREWVTTSVATWIIKELVMESSKQGSSYFSKGLLTHFDFYIMPILNPDGYRHSWDYNRLWRKSRRPINNSLFGLGTAIGCRGVDLNRNFGFEWGGEGSASSSCSLVFKGDAPFSEPETKAVRDFVNNGAVSWLAYFSLHSYGQKWMTPWGYTNKALPKDFREMIRIARIGARALQAVHNTAYDVGSSSDILYLAAGGSDDWWKGVVGVKYAYTLELRDSGFFGFLLPASQIQPTAEETWAGISASLRAIIRSN